MNYLRSSATFRFFSFAFLLTLLFSCNKDPYEVGYDLLPPSDTLNVITTDTITVEAFSVIQDSVRSDKHSSLVLGSVTDPVFGTVTSSFYTAVKLSDEGPDFGTNPVLDSMILMLFYSGYYGDTLTPLKIKVYELSDDVAYDSIRYTNQTLGYYPALLAEKSFRPNLHDSIKIGNTKFAPHLRVNLSEMTNYLGNKILTAPSSALKTNTAFIKFMKGLYVTTDPVLSSGALLNFAITGNYSRIILYYHDGNNPANDSLQFSLEMNQSCGRFIHTDHYGYLNSSHDLKQQILNHDSARGSEKIFLDGMGGIKVKVKFPYFSSFGKGKIIAVNDALLELNNYETDTIYAPPSALMLYRVDSAGRIGYLIDESEGVSYFGGNYDADKRRYTFRLTQHLQKILQKSYKTSFDLYLMVNSPIASSLSPNRVILNGYNPFIPGPNPGRMRLRITYTVLH